VPGSRSTPRMFSAPCPSSAPSSARTLPAKLAVAAPITPGGHTPRRCRPQSPGAAEAVCPPAAAPLSAYLGGRESLPSTRLRTPRRSIPATTPRGLAVPSQVPSGPAPPTPADRRGALRWDIRRRHLCAIACRPP
jgi:hypothetical protein